MPSPARSKSSPSRARPLPWVDHRRRSSFDFAGEKVMGELGHVAFVDRDVRHVQAALAAARAPAARRRPAAFALVVVAPAPAPRTPCPGPGPGPVRRRSTPTARPRSPGRPSNCSRPSSGSAGRTSSAGPCSPARSSAPTGSSRCPRPTAPPAPAGGSSTSVTFTVTTVIGRAALAVVGLHRHRVGRLRLVVERRTGAQLPGPGVDAERAGVRTLQRIGQVVVLRVDRRHRPPQWARPTPCSPQRSVSVRLTLVEDRLARWRPCAL